MRVINCRTYTKQFKVVIETQKVNEKATPKIPGKWDIAIKPVDYTVGVVGSVQGTYMKL